MRRLKDSKSNICTEGVDVYVAGISVEVGAHYPGRSAALSETTTRIKRCGEEMAEVSRGHSRTIRLVLRPEHGRTNGDHTWLTTK